MAEVRVSFFKNGRCPHAVSPTAHRPKGSSFKFRRANRAKQFLCVKCFRAEKQTGMKGRKNFYFPTLRQCRANCGAFTFKNWFVSRRTFATGTMHREKFAFRQIVRGLDFIKRKGHGLAVFLGEMPSSARACATPEAIAEPKANSGLSRLAAASRLFSSSAFRYASSPSSARLSASNTGAQLSIMAAHSDFVIQFQSGSYCSHNRRDHVLCWPACEALECGSKLPHSKAAQSTAGGSGVICCGTGILPV